MISTINDIIQFMQQFFLIRGHTPTVCVFGANFRDIFFLSLSLSSFNSRLMWRKNNFNAFDEIFKVKICLWIKLQSN